MAWLPIEFDTPDKTEILRMSEALRKSPEEVLGCVVLVWIWVQQNTADGRIKKGSLSMIDRAARRAGFGKAMGDAEWAKMDGDELVFPNWDRHNSKNAKARKLDTERKNSGRKADMSRTRTGHDRDKGRTTAEYIREEKNSSSSKVNSAPYARANPSGDPAAAADFQPKKPKAEDPHAKDAPTYQAVREALRMAEIDDPKLSELASAMSLCGIPADAVQTARRKVGVGKGVGAIIRSLERQVEQARAVEKFAKAREWYQALPKNRQGDVARQYQSEKHSGRMLPSGWLQARAWFEWLEDLMQRLQT
jgi:hypothetical protein